MANPGTRTTSKGTGAILRFLVLLCVPGKTEMPGSSPQARYNTAAAPPQAEGEPSKDQETGDNIFCSDEQQPAPAAGAAGGRPLASDSRPWPEVRGNLTLRLDPREKGGISALCTIQDSVVTMRASRRSVQSPDEDPAVIVRVRISQLTVRLLPEYTSMFCAASSERPDENIYCFAENQEKRNKWVAMLRRMGVTIYGSSGEVALTATTVVPSIRQGHQPLPSLLWDPHETGPRVCRVRTCQVIHRSHRRGPRPSGPHRARCAPPLGQRVRPVPHG